MSVMILLGTPNLMMTLFMMNFLAAADVIFLTDSASIHFVKVSIARNSNLKPLGATRKAPKISSPQAVNGHHKWIIYRA